MDIEAKRLRVLLIAPSSRITGGQSVQAAKLFSILEEVPELQIRFYPIDPLLPGGMLWVKEVKFLRTVVMFLVYFAGLLRRVPQCDILHVFTAGLSSYTLWTIPALLLSRVFRKKFLMHYHDGQAEQHIEKWRSARPTIALADELIVPSGFLVDVFARYGLKSKVISNIVELDRFSYKERYTLQPTFMTNRMLEPLYNVPCILRAFALVQQQYAQATLTVAHDGYLRATLEALAEELHLRNVSFIGRVPFEHIPELYAAADIYVTTPNIDNMPGSILESFASGLPVIATKAGGIPYIAKDRENALLVDLDDHVAVAECALELLTTPQLVRSLTHAAAVEVQKYHCTAVRNEWIMLYRQMVGVYVAALEH